MKSIFILILIISIPFIGFSQSKKNTYFQFEIAVPLQGNPNRSQTNYQEIRNTSWFLPNGIKSELGFGFHKNKLLALGIHSGFFWKEAEKLVCVPVYANFRLSPKVGKETRIYAQLGYGKSFALGRGNLSGLYRKMSVGIENADDISIFVEFAAQNLVYNDFIKINSVSLGICLTTF